MEILDRDRGHPQNDDMLATGLVDVRSYMDAVDGWESASWSETLVAGEEVKQLQKGEASWLVAPLRSCRIEVGGKIWKAGNPIALTVQLSVGFG